MGATLSPKKMFLAAVLVVAASTAFLPAVRGYGTVLFQTMALGSWTVVALATSGSFADRHHPVVWAVVLLLNVAGFSLPALIILGAVRTRSSAVASASLATWLAFYLALLFVLFPATDGP